MIEKNHYGSFLHMIEIYDKFDLDLIYHPGNNTHLYQISVYYDTYFNSWNFIIYEPNIQ